MKYRFNHRSASMHRLMKHNMVHVQLRHLELQTNAMKLQENMLPIGFSFMKFEQLVNIIF